ncbi:MAG: YhcH/YjgK/YiaL family protein [Mailhella sp.]|nr:YhcH/YjgK/YiaL family protein [Mailhella sp.]
MIIDTFPRGAAYDLGPVWKKIFPEISSLARLGAQAGEGRHLIAGGPGQGGAYANVEEYAPRHREDALYEGHAAMADVQIVLEGDEFIDVFPLSGSEAEASRDDERDLVLYAEKPDAAARIHLRPGLFALIMPGEAHMPCLAAGSARVRKLVVKIPADSLRVPAGA